MPPLETPARCHVSTRVSWCRMSDWDSQTSMIERGTSTTQQADMPMKSSSQLIYNYIDEHKDFLQNSGTCVIDNFIGMYGEELKLTRDGFITMCKERRESKKTRTHPAQAFAQLFGPFS